MPEKVVEMATEIQELYTKEDPQEVAIRNYLEKNAHTKEYVCAREIWKDALLRTDEMPPWGAHNISETLQKLGWAKGNRKEIPNFGKCYVFNRPKDYHLQVIEVEPKTQVDLFVEEVPTTLKDLFIEEEPTALRDLL